MTLIEALRQRLPHCEDVEDDELLRVTDGSFVRLCAELDVAAHVFCTSMANEGKRIVEGVNKAMSQLDKRVTKIEDDREAEGRQEMGDDL